MSEGEFKKRILEIIGAYEKVAAAIPTADNAVLRSKVKKELEKGLEAVAEAKKELYDYWRRGLIHEGLVKWFGTRKGIHKGTHKQSLKVVSKGKAEKFCGNENCSIKIPHTHGLCGCVYCKECGQVIRSCVTPLELKLVSRGPCKVCGKEVWITAGSADDRSRCCDNLGGKECPGANARDCIARIKGLACPTYSKKELMEIKSKC